MVGSTLLLRLLVKAVRGGSGLSSSRAGGLTPLYHGTFSEAIVALPVAGESSPFLARYWQYA